MDGRHPPQDDRGRSQDAMSSSNLDHLITLGGRREGRPARATSSLYDEKGSLPN